MKFRSFARFCVLSSLLFLIPGCGKKDNGEVVATPTPSEPPEAVLQRQGYTISAADLVRASATGDVEVVKIILDGGVDPNSQDAEGSTALILAAEAGNLSVVKMLVEKGADPNRPGRESWTALMSSAFYDRPKVVEYLLSKGADAKLKDINLWSAFMKAVHQGHVEPARLLAAQSKDEVDAGLMLAALYGKTEVAQALIESGANINAKAKAGKTALMFAAMKGHMDTVKMLLAKGADPLAIDEAGSTASILALEKGFVDVSKLIDDSVAGIPAATPPPIPAATPTPAPTPEMPAATPTPVASAQNSDAAALTAKPPAPAFDPNAPAVVDSGTPAAGASEFVVWAARFQIDGSTPAAANADPDADGFSNREEFEAGTDPTDADLHPSRVSRLRMISYSGEDVPLVLQSFSGGKATLRRSDTGESVEVSNGSTVTGMPYKVSGFREKFTTDKNGQKVDISELTLINVKTGSKVILLPDLPARSPETAAVLQLEGVGEKITVHVDQEFSLPGDRATKLKVIDLRPTEVVIRVVDSGETATIQLKPN